MRLRLVPSGAPRHPLRITSALILSAIGALVGFPLQVVFIAGAFHLLWEL